MPTALPIHPAANLLPMLPPAELQELADNIRAHGLKFPITVYNGEILDGRNRFAACEMAGVEPRTVEWDGIGSAVEFVLSANVIRRQLTPAQRGTVAVDAIPLFEAEAKQRRLANLKRGAEPPEGNETFPSGRDESRRSLFQAAKAAHAGIDATRTLAAVKKAAPAVFDLAKQGKVTVAEAERMAKPKPKKIREQHRLSPRARNILADATLAPVDRKRLTHDIAALPVNMQVEAADLLASGAVKTIGEAKAAIVKGGLTSYDRAFVSVRALPEDQQRQLAHTILDILDGRMSA